jgi:ABC-type nitrate/sulfonate/bicarbonate transport system substrate-binding protein
MPRVVMFAAFLLATSVLASAQAPLKHITVATQAATNAIISKTGVAQGLFREQGLDVDLRLLPGGNDAIQALASGSADFAEASNAQFLSAAVKGLPVIGIAVHSYGFPGKLIAAGRNTGLKSLQEFKGKRIGLQFGTGVYTVFLMALEREGLKPSDFVLSNVRVSDMPAAMASDTFDAVMAWEPQARRIIEMGRGKEVITAAEFEKIAEVTYPMVVMSTQNVIRERPEVVQSYVNAFARAQRFVDAHRPETVKLFRTILPPETSAALSDGEVSEQIFKMSYFDHAAFSESDLADLRRTGDFLNRLGTLSAKPDLDKSINQQFARQAAALK